MPAAGSFTVTTSGADGTGAVAAALAPHVRAGDVVLLTGGLATGKTTFVKALARALGSPSAVTSPTFTLAQFYDVPAPAGTRPATRQPPARLLHIDAYRLSGIHEYRDLGLAEYLDECVTLVEWGEKVAVDFPCHLVVEFRCRDEAPNARQLEFSSRCERWAPVLSELAAGMLEEAKHG